MDLVIGTISTVPMGSTFSCPTCWQLSRMSGVKLADDGSLWVSCGACGAKIPASAQVLAAQRCAPAARSGAVASLRPRNPFSAPEGTCPECLAPHPANERSCSACNLDFDSFRRPGIVPSKKLAEAWSQVVLRWPDNEQHAKFQVLAVDLNELTAANRLYALWLAYLPHDPWAKQWKLELLMLSQIAAEARLKQRPNRISLRVAVGLASAAMILFTVSLIANLG